MSDDMTPPQPEPPNMAWLLTFADLVSLLITFFVLLYSMKSVDESQWDELRGSLTGVFADEAAIVVVHPEDFQSSNALSSMPADSLPYLENVLKNEFKRDEILSKMRINYNGRLNTLTLSLPSAVLFHAGKVQLQRQGRIAMIQLADKLRHLDNRMQFSGYTNPTPAFGEGIPTNWELAMLRAIEVANVFYERGVSKSLPAFSFGDSRFEDMDPNLSEEEKYRQARRVDVIIYGDANDL